MYVECKDNYEEKHVHEYNCYNEQLFGDTSVILLDVPGSQEHGLNETMVQYQLIDYFV